MATATKKSHAAGRLPRRAGEARVSESMEFLLFEDNGGNYLWTIVATDGATLARSENFASYDDAEKAAKHVRDGAASALFERRAGGASPVDLGARRTVTSGASHTKRWSDEGGSSNEAVAKWPAPR